MHSCVIGKFGQASLFFIIVQDPDYLKNGGRDRTLFDESCSIITKQV